MNRHTSNKDSPFFVLKVIDGLFLANAGAARDIEFLRNNKIKLIVNCAPSDIKFISNQSFIIEQFNWHDPQGQFIQQISEKAAIELTTKIQSCLESYESVAFCSKKGSSRALTVCILYFIHKFQWTLYKALQFVNCKKSDLEVRASFLKLLVNYQSNLRQNHNYHLEDAWESRNSTTIYQDARVINNTYLNSIGGRQNTIKQHQNQTEPKKSRKTVKIIQKIEVIPQIKQLKPTQVQNHTIHLDRVKSRLNEFLQQKYTKNNTNDTHHFNFKQQKKLPIHHRRRLSQKCVTQEVVGSDQYSQKKQDSKQLKIKRSITPVTKTRQVERYYSQKKRSIDTLPKFVSPSPTIPHKTIEGSERLRSHSQDVYNLSINVSINQVNFYKQKSSKISNYNRDKLKVYLNRTRRKSFLSVTQKEKRQRTPIKNQPGLRSDSFLRSQSILSCESGLKDSKILKERSNSARKRKFLTMTQ